jgi:Na/Pi-cotransporter
LAPCALLLLSGCDQTPRGLEPDKIISITSETQLGLPGELRPNCVRVELLSKAVPGLLGGKGEPHPIAGAKLIVTPLDPASETRSIPAEGLTDAGGNFGFDVQLGTTFGDHYLDISCEDAPEIRTRLRFVVGMSAENGKQEVAAGDTLPKPIRIKLTGSDGKPLVNEAVFFSLAKQPGKKGKVTKSLVKTDTNGVAEVGLKTDAHATGKYEIRAEVADTKTGFFTRPIFIEAMAFCTSGILIGVFGGLAIFIFGMTLMSDGLQQIAGSKMKSTLAFITRNRLSALFAGTFVTALIQSSSATTVMTVGFVNAGLLSLQQAIGVVFGANIGTTVTGQMVSFKLDGLALPSIIIGVILLIVTRKAVYQGTARTILGFGLLFFGMTLMSDELKSVSAFPSFVHFFQTFDCAPQPGQPMPFGAILGAIGIGTLMTMVVQSSSATIGLAIALANSGLLNFWTAFPIVLGDNIGTTITAVLASLNANRTAKQTAAAHSMFNILGTGIMVALFYVPVKNIPCFFYLVNNVTAGNVFQGENIGRHVAMAHTLFNVTNVVVMTPFIGVLAWICEHIIPGKKAPVHVVRLETHLLNTPPLALICAMSALADMTEKAWKASLEALRGYKNGKPVSVDAIKTIEDEVDRMQSDIMDYLVHLTRKELTEEQAQAIPVLMHCVNDAERISDLAYLIARRAASQPAHVAKFTDGALQEMKDIIDKACFIADLTLESLRGGTGAVKAVEVVMQDMKSMARRSIQGHVERLQRGDCKPERGMVYVEVVAALENIVRHLENIAQRSDKIGAAT